jgi:hypothetical protein
MFCHSLWLPLHRSKFAELKQRKKPSKLDVCEFFYGRKHRYRKKNRLLKVCYEPTTSATFSVFFSFFLAVAIDSTNETNKAGGTCH